MKLRLEQLFYFEVLAQENSFNKAAAKLHIAQPSLTANIKSLENELNKTLLIRNTRGFSLTEDGKKVLTFSKAVTSLYQTLQKDLNESNQAASGKLAIVASKFFSEIILEQFLVQFYDKFPEIKVSCFENDFIHLRSTFLPQAVNFLLSHGYLPPRKRNVRPVCLFLTKIFLMNIIPIYLYSRTRLVFVSRKILLWPIGPRSIRLH